MGDQSTVVVEPAIRGIQLRDERDFRACPLFKLRVPPFVRLKVYSNHLRSF